MLDDVAILSSAEFEGRQTGTDGDLKAAEFVSRRFASMHLAPSPTVSSLTGARRQSDLSMPVPIYTILDSPLLEIVTPDSSSAGLTPGEYLPVLDSPAANATGPVVFVGYGIADPVRGYDEYAGIDVRKKIVLFLRGKPDHYSTPVSHAEKERAAREHGAAAYLTVTGPVLNPYEARRGMTTDPSAFYGRQGDVTPLPGAWISPAMGDRILSAADPESSSLKALQELLSQSKRPQSRPTRAMVRMAWNATESQGTLVNVIATIPGRVPELNGEIILVGAHRDHFGRQAGLTFPGADDNASGTAVLLEVARAITEAGLRPKRSIHFVSFSGEEQGMLGSRFYVSNSLGQTRRPKAMINIDHAGIGNGRLTVGVTGLEKTAAMEAGARAELADRLDLFGFFPGGDHVPFKEAGVPTITVVSGGAHPHFHKPTDTPDTINPEILESVARYVFALLWQLANQP